MGGPKFIHPCVTRKPLYWLRPGVLMASRRKFRVDGSNRWRYAFASGHPQPPNEWSQPFEYLLGKKGRSGFRFLILGDTGEGDASQIGTLPLIRALHPDFMIINGDVVYPSGRMEDYEAGFFRPYRGLRCPIWAVPGNHEYYSPNHGREFWEVFCSTILRQRWDEADLVLRPQPGTFWELSEPSVPLVVLGVDTGLKARLDGTFRMRPDNRQLAWLDRRLLAADRAGRPVILLFHIPGLAKQRHEQEKGLGRLHRVLASHRSVRLVLGGHWHNYQRYAPQQFQAYLEAEHKATLAGRPPDYIVSGGGGAYLHGTKFKKKHYPATHLYPTREWWQKNAKFPHKLVNQLGVEKWMIAHGARLVGVAAAKDPDEARVLSFLLVDVPDQTQDASPAPVTVTPVFLDHVNDLFPNASGGDEIDLCDPAVVAEPDAVAACLKTSDDHQIVLEAT